MKLMLKLSVLGLLSLSAVAQAADGVEFGGNGFVRYESKKNPNYIENNGDNANYTQMRASVFAKKSLEDGYGFVYLAPQFSKTAGKSEFVPSSATANTETATSGGSYNSKVDMYEAYVALNPMQDSKLAIYLGRQALAYGDELMISQSGWSIFGRSFDGVKAQYNAEKWKLDLLSFITSEKSSTTTASAGVSRVDTHLYGAYFNINLGDYLKNADLYYLRKDNLNALTGLDVHAYGIRLKSNVGSTSFDYRVEATLENGNSTNATGDRKEQKEHQWDAEVGYTTGFYATRLGFESYYSTEYYDQFYTSGHKYLGFVDQLSRKNINGYVIHLSSKPMEKFSASLDYQVFKRTKDNIAAYDYSGTSLGTAGTNKDIGSEFDLVLGYQLSSQLTVAAGYGKFMPGDYIKDQGATKDDDVNFGYLQLSAKI